MTYRLSVTLTHTIQASPHAFQIIHHWCFVEINNNNWEGMFRFDNYLILSPNFIPSVQNVWQHDIIGVPMYSITRKVKALELVFRHQRRNKGDLSENVRLAKEFLEKAQILVRFDRQNDLFLFLEHFCRLVYAKAAKMEQIIL